MQSVWRETAAGRHFPPLKENKTTDVLVVGGGMAGVLCTYFLKQAGIDCLLAEAKQIGDGTTGGTTAKLTVQHGLIYDRLIRRHGMEQAAAYLRTNLDALSMYRRLAQQIDCDFAEAPAYVYTQEDPSALRREAEAYVRLGLRPELTEVLPLPFPVTGALGLAGQAQFHPLKFLYGISKDLPIHEETPIREIDIGKGRAVTADGHTITAQKIIVATHFPMISRRGLYPLKLYQHRSYMLALEGAPPVPGMFVSAEKTGFSFRQDGNLLLLGGGAGRTGKRCGGFQALESFADHHYPQAEIRYRWAEQDCMSLDGLPYIGRYSRHTPNLFVATGFNKWGMTGAMAAAIRLTGMIQTGREQDNSPFYPSRSMLTPQLLVNTGEAVLHLLSPLPKRCTHMGCVLHWNKAERSWDCPCHGSRYDGQGRVLNNPAIRPKHLE